MKQIIFLAFMLLGLGVKAQSLIDQDLQQFAKLALVDGIKEYGDVSFAGVVIMECETGNVVTNVSIEQHRGEIRDIPNGNFEALPAGIARAVLYLTLMGVINPDYLVETGDGHYIDSISGCSIADFTHDIGGFGTISLKKALDVSDVGMIKAAEVAFGRNLQRYRAAVRESGIMFEPIIDELDEINKYQEDDLNLFLSPCDIIGYKSHYSLLQQTAWINLVANMGKLLMRFNKDDSTIPICEVKKKAGLDSLASALLETVEYGTGIHMRSKYIHVAGLVNVSPPDANNCRGCFAAAFFPYKSDTPKYTIGVYVNKHNRPAGRIIASSIAGRIINYVVENLLHDEVNQTRLETMPSKEHPSEKGRNI